MVVSPRMKRQLHLALVLCLVLPAAVAEAPSAGSQHTGEILGTHPGERSLTLRVSTPDGKDLVVFHVPEDAVIRREGSDQRLEFADLKPGMRASVSSRRSDGRREAVEILIRHGSKRS